MACEALSSNILNQRDRLGFVKAGTQTLFAEMCSFIFEMIKLQECVLDPCSWARAYTRHLMGHELIQGGG